MEKFIFIFLGFSLLISACSSPQKNSPKDDYQAISALGDTLYAPPLDQEKKQKLEKLKVEYEGGTEDPKVIIPYGQLLADLGNHKQAAAIFSQGIDNSNDNARIYLLRGQQYIILRKFDEAISDFTIGINLIDSDIDSSTSVEVSGKDTTMVELQYQLGITYYLQRNYEKAEEVLQECLNDIDNSEMRVASFYWLYMSLRRAGKDGIAGQILELISEDMNISQNKDYHQLLLVYKGVFKPDMLLHELKENGSIENATIGYGVGNWHYINGRKKRAQKLFRKVYESSHWDLLGYIAAELDLANAFKN